MQSVCGGAATCVVGTPRRHSADASPPAGGRAGTPLGRSVGTAIDQQEDTTMNGKRSLTGLVLADFTALTAWAVWTHGYVGFFEAALTNLASIQVGIDLVIALSLVTLWMWRDAKERGVSPIPYVLLTATLGSIGPLLYLFTRLREPAHHRAPVMAS
jgi:hypothetical protein